MAVQTKTAKYRIYDGTDWHIYHFETDVSQVLTSSTKKFVSSSVTVNGVAFSLDNTANGASVNIYGTDVKMSSSDNTTLKAAIEARIPLSGTTALAGSIVPSTTNSVSLGSGTKYFEFIYGKNVSVSNELGISHHTIVNSDGNLAINLDDNVDHQTTWKLSNSGGTLYVASTSDLNSYIPKTLTSAKGDLIYASAASTPARLAIGSSGQFLKVGSSGTPEWATVSLGTAAAKAYTTSVTSGSNDLVTSGAVYTAINALPTPMQFKGTVGTDGTITWANLPSAASSNNGQSYKVITDHNGTNDNPKCKAGDMIISNGTSWVVIPSGDEPSGTVTSVGISVPTGLSVSNTPITSSGTIAISLASGYSIPTTTKQSEWDAKQSALSTQTAYSAKGSSTKVAKITTNSLGQVTAIEEVNIAFPTTTDTKNTAGSTDTSSKIFLIGATSQDANPQTYSQDTAYVGTDGCLYSNSKRVSSVYVDASNTPSGAKSGDIWIN